MSTVRPKDAIRSKKGYSNPTSKPIAPISSRIMIANPKCSNPKRLNSFFIFGDIKYDIAYPINEILEKIAQAMTIFISL
jgi:hypothetical protein